MTRMFINFIKDRKDISPKDVFYDYNKVRKDVLEFTKKSDNAKMGQLVESFVTFLTTSRPPYTIKELENISTFLTDIPSDIGVIFLSKLEKFDSNSQEFKYVTKIHIELVSKFEKYKTNFYEAMVDASRRARS